MKSVLIYHSITGPLVWETTTDEQRNNAHLALFQVLDSAGKFTQLDIAESQLYNMARRGSAKFARAFLILQEVPLKEAVLQEAPVPRPTVEVKMPEGEVELPVQASHNVGTRGF